MPVRGEHKLVCGAAHIVRDNINAIQLSECLGRHSNQEALLVPIPHLGVRSFAFIARHKDIPLDFTELVPCTLVVDIAATMKICQDDHPLFVIVIIKEPSIENLLVTRTKREMTHCVTLEIRR